MTKKKRFFTINRSYSPGSQRLGAVVWTGDIRVSFQELANQGGYLTNWVMAGVPYVTCKLALCESLQAQAVTEFSVGDLVWALAHF